MRICLQVDAYGKRFIVTTAILYLNSYILFKFEFRNIAAPQEENQILVHLPNPNGPLTQFPPTLS